MRNVDPNYHQTLRLSPEQETRWQADLDTLCQDAEQHDTYPLRLGDHYRELKARWGNKGGALLVEAAPSSLRSCPLYLARQRARIAQVLGPENPLRRTGLSLSILRL